jgi:hypothetical protein
MKRKKLQKLKETTEGKSQKEITKITRKKDIND